MDPVKIKLRKPNRVILDYGHTELELREDSMLCNLVEKISIVVKDEKILNTLEINNLILERISK